MQLQHVVDVAELFTRARREPADQQPCSIAWVFHHLGDFIVFLEPDLRTRLQVLE
jgi:hypothetical protein